MHMKRLLLYILSALSLINYTYAQTYKLSSPKQTINTCKGVFASTGYDVSGTYQYNFYRSYESGQMITFTSGGSPLRINFVYANFMGTDKLEIWDGTTTSAPSVKIATLTGTSNNHKDYTSNSGKLTFKFTGSNNPFKDAAPNAYGWQGLLGCLPAGCDGNSPASDICSDAPTICNLDGYCGSTSGWYTADNINNLEGVGNPLNSCYDPNTGYYGATIQNNSWLAFIANSTSASLTIKSSNCSDANRGMQAIILSTADCEKFYSKSSCIYSGQGTFNLTANSLTVGAKYYIMIDGGWGNDCDYTVSANTGVKTVTVSSNVSTICEGLSVNLSATGGSSYQWSDGVNTIPAGANVTVSPTTTTTYTCTVVGTCATQYPTIKITVKPKPVATATPNTMTFCSGGSTSIALTSTVGGTTYAWTASGSGNISGLSPTSGSSNPIAHTLSTTNANAATATYTITPTANGCTGNDITVPITVNAVPTLTLTPTSQTFCSGGTTNIALTSNVAGTTYGWTVQSATGVSGASGPGTGSPIAQTLTATGTVAGTVVYEVTPTSPAGCVGTKKTVTITVNPTPTTTPTVPSQTICSGSSTSIGLTSNISGATFNWSRVVTGGVTGSADGPGSNIVQTLYTNGTNVGSVEYTITATTPAPASCPSSGTTKVLVTVNPIPTISIGATSSTICNGGSTQLTATVDPLGGTFLWTPGNLGTDQITVSPTSTTSYNCQYTLNGCSNSTSKNITVNQLPANVAITPNPASAIICSGKSITLTASSTDGGGTYLWAPGGQTTAAISVSPGADQTYTVTYTLPTTCAQTATQLVTVKTTPTVTVTPTSGTICNGTSTTLNTSVSSGGGTYAWSPGGSTASSITVSPSSTTTYSLTYTATNACASAVNTTTVTVNPKDNANFSYSSATYCSSGMVNPTVIWGPSALMGGVFSSTPAGLVLNSSTGEITLGNPPAGSTPNTYAVKYTTNGICPNSKTVNVTITISTDANFSYSAASFCQYGTDPLPIFNPGTSAGTFSASPAGLVFVNDATGEVDLNLSSPGVYKIINLIPPGNGCSEAKDSVSLTITAAPVLNASSFNASVCSPDGPNISLSGGTTYDWTVSSPAKITGASAGNGAAINQTLTTTDSVPGIVHYYVTPHTAACTGKMDTVDVTVNPVPDVSATPVTPSVCSGLVTNIKLTSSIPAATFSWTVKSATDANGASAGTGSAIEQTLTATTASPGSVVYTITPKSFTCDGTPIDVTVAVNPNPTTVVTIPAMDDTICSNEMTNLHLSSPTVGTTFYWTVNQSGIQGGMNGLGTDTGAGVDIKDVLTSIGTAPGKAVYTITGSASACSGSSIVDSVIVNPIPTLVVTPLNQEICSGAQTNIALVSNQSPVTFSWKVSPGTILGAFNDTANSIMQTLVNPGSIVDTVVYKIIATAGSCSSALDPLVDSVVAKIAVNPKPVVITATPLTICSDDSVKIVLLSSVTGSAFTYKAFTTGVIGSGDGAGDTIAQHLSVLNLRDSVEYTIVPTSPKGCVGDPFMATVYVNPRPEISFLPSAIQSVCSGSAVSVDIVSSVPGTTITWTPQTSIITGTKSGSGTTPVHIDDILSIASDTAVSIIYDVTAVSGSGCSNTALASLLKFTVNPLPKVIPDIKVPVICDGDSLIVPLTSNVVGTDYSWEVTQTGVTGAYADSAQTTIRQKLKLTGNMPGTVVYKITSNSPTGCHNATAEILTITVNPLDNAAYHYSALKYCQSEVDPAAIITGGTTGSFTSIPTGIVFLDPNSGLIDLTASTPGKYNITYTTNGACQQSSNVSVDVNSNPTADTSKISSTDSYCGTQTGTISGITKLTGALPITYEWKNSGGVVVDTGHVAVGDSIRLDSIAPGIYSVKITDANGCSLTIGQGGNLNIKYLQSVTAKFTSDVSDGEAPVVVQFTDQSVLNGTTVINYNWNFDNGTTSTLQNPLPVTFNDIKTFNVCLVVDDGGKGCKDTVCHPIEVTTSSEISIVPNIFTPNGDGMNDILKITAKGLASVHAEIYNRWGQKEYEWNTLNGGWDGYSASGVPAVQGTYYIVLIAVGADKNKTAFPAIKQAFELVR